MRTCLHSIISNSVKIFILKEDETRNKCTNEKIEVAPIIEKMTKIDVRRSSGQMSEKTIVRFN